MLGTRNASDELIGTEVQAKKSRISLVRRSDNFSRGLIRRVRAANGAQGDDVGIGFRCRRNKDGADPR